MAFDPFIPASTLAEQIRTKKLSPTDVIQGFLERIDAVNPRLNAFITVLKEDARKQAEDAAAEIRRGRYRGPLHGIPFAPKDIFATKGVRTTNGSRFFENAVPDFDATAVQRLKQAGAILLGKVAMHEFAAGDMNNQLFGIARNPWNPEHRSGGSSSGSGVAVGAAMSPLSLGTDTGGSIRGPASLCGIVGLKPTYGRVSRYGVTTLCWTLDHAGPMTRTVEDNAIVLQTIAGRDPLDPTCSAEPVADYRRAMKVPIRGLRIGVPEWYFQTAHPAVNAAVRAALKHLETLGARVEEVQIPHAPHAGPAWWAICWAEETAFHEERLKKNAGMFDNKLRPELDEGFFVTATDFIKANRVRTLVMDDFAKAFTKVDVIIMPGSLTPAAPIVQTSAPTAANPARPNVSTTNVGDLTGLPALVMPCGFSENGLPLAMQIYGKPFDEATIYRVAYQYEQSTEWHKRRPPV